MSINKFMLSLAAAGILGASSAVAETSGAFVGVQAGYSTLKVKFGSENDDGAGNKFESSMPTDANGFRYGFVAGYKQFFTPEFGVRYYASVDLGADYKKDVTENFRIRVKSYNIAANADTIYNFISGNDLDFGAFLGLSLGYANHKMKMQPQGATEEPPIIKPSGFDAGINFGLRANIAQNHGIELYSRFALLQQKEERKEVFDFGGYESASYKIQQAYQIGLRYSFNF